MWIHSTSREKLLLKTWQNTCVIHRTQKLVLFSALRLEVWTLCLDLTFSLDLTLLHLSWFSPFFFITADVLLLALHLHFLIPFQASLNHVIAQPLLCASDLWHFVIRSALFFIVLMYARFVNFFSTTSCAFLYFSITCFILPSPLLDAHAFADWLSTWFMRITSCPNSDNERSSTHHGWHEDGMKRAHRHIGWLVLSHAVWYVCNKNAQTAWEKWRVKCICLHPP